MKGNSISSMISQNLYINKDNLLKWRINLDAFKKNFLNLIGFEINCDNNNLYQGPILVLIGSKSISFEFDCFKKIFPNFVKERDVFMIDDSSNYIFN